MRTWLLGAKGLTRRHAGQSNNFLPSHIPDAECEPEHVIRLALSGALSAADSLRCYDAANPPL
ncbi:protein of unknown function [Candidatus Filomicrobium marinum]|nr:protein of unknown function [Candidatus Filomicrobium marinum]